MVGHLFARGWKGVKRKFDKATFYMETRIVKARRGYEVYTNPVCSVQGYVKF